jgi:hypothetical protein
MDFAKILAQLREELKNVDDAIETLERLQQRSTRRRGRPSTDSDASSEEALPSPLKNAATDRTSASRKPRRHNPTPT